MTINAFSISRLLPLALLAVASTAHAQISLASTVDLAMKTSPRVKIAQADLDKANAQLSETHDVYIPQVTGGAGLGNSYGYSPNPPTLFTASGGSLVLNLAQFSYIRSARWGVTAAKTALEEARESAAEEAALAFVTLDHDQKREAGVKQQAEHARLLVQIVQERLDAGRDTPINLTQAQLTAAKMHQAVLHAEDQSAIDRDHLGRLVGLNGGLVRIDGNFPTAPLPLLDGPELDYMSPAVASAFANAKAKQAQAYGDTRYLYRPQISLIVQYNRYATFTDSFKQLQLLNGNSGAQKIGANEGVYGVQIVIPFFDKLHQAKARESAADAAHALHEAENAQYMAADGRAKLRHTIAELEANTDVAALEQKLSQQQLEILRVQLQSAGTTEGTQMTPRDEQNALIQERERYLAVLDANFQLRQAQITLLRQTGGLEAWLKTLTVTTPAP